MRTLSESAKNSLKDYAHRYNLAYIPISADEIALKGKDFSVRFSLEREGINTRYIDECSGAQYNVAVFLFSIRGARCGALDLSKIDGPLDAAELGQLFKLFDGWGIDILAGDKSWTRDYAGSPIMIPDFRAL